MADLPYKAEYAKSGRSTCKGCAKPIAQESLRLAVIVQSSRFDGKTPTWFHHECFFHKHVPKSTDEIGNFEQLRWDDQELIRNKLSTCDKSLPDDSLKENFRVEYAKSSRSSCKMCGSSIIKGEIRISKKDFESSNAKRFGALDKWYHPGCFADNREDLQFYQKAELLPGFESLKHEDRDTLSDKLKAIKRKCDSEVEETDVSPSKIPCKDTSAKKEQNQRMYFIRDGLKDLRVHSLESLLRHNGMSAVSGGKDSLLDQLSDAMAFGVPSPCPVCQGQLAFRSGAGYACHGQISEWTRCDNVVKDPPKKPFECTENLSGIDFFKSYKSQVETRLFDEATVSGVQKENTPKETKVEWQSKPLEGITLCLDVKMDVPTKTLTSKIKDLGGHVSSHVEKNTAALVSTPENVTSRTAKVKAAEKHCVQVVPTSFLDEVSKGGAILLIQKLSLAPWGSDVESRIYSEGSEKNSEENKVKVIAKNGAVVDPDSGLAETCHILKDEDRFYSVVLNKVDLGSGSNSYYKMQLLKEDTGNAHHVFMSWGRIGTSIGGTKLVTYNNTHDATFYFHDQFFDKTRNMFKANEYKKYPGKFFPLKIDFMDNADNTDTKEGFPKVESSVLKRPVIDLLTLIFDIDAMKKSMVEFELDLKKLPLGKISNDQIKDGYLVLQEASSILTNKPANMKTLLLDCSNRFYSLIPHDFGMNNPPLLDNEEIIKLKSDMLETILDIAIAYSMINDSDGKTDDVGLQYYKKLKAEIEPIDRDSEEFHLAEKYLKNTHSPLHQGYTLELVELFSVKREGEEERFQKFKKLKNRKLLWHGSRVTNFAGILSQGLRIAPPEAPCTGYMFGKGIYFADLVSKSANYCGTRGDSCEALMLLCEVALGNMHELLSSSYITKLPKGKESTKGIGRLYPDPEMTVIKDGVEIPLGKPIDRDGTDGLYLQHNEYIVYDVSQVNMKYLLRVKFVY